MNELSKNADSNNVNRVLAPCTFYEYGAMSSRFKLEAKNKLTAYATMVLHYQNSAHLMVIYEPETCKEDSWFNITGQISERLDEIFGGENSFHKYITENIEEIKACYKTIKRVC